MCYGQKACAVAIWPYYMYYGQTAYTLTTIHVSSMAIIYVYYGHDTCTMDRNHVLFHTQPISSPCK